MSAFEKSYTEIKNCIKVGTSIAFWGAGETLQNTFNKLSLPEKLTINVVDKNPNYWGQSNADTLNIPCKEPTKQLLHSTDLIIITSSSYKQIISR